MSRLRFDPILNKFLLSTTLEQARSANNLLAGDVDLGDNNLLNVGRVILSDNATTPPLNVTERSSEPSSPSSGDIYLDDGTNTSSGDPGWRRYTGSAWEDVGAASGVTTDHGSLSGLGDDDHPQYIKDSEFTQDSGILVGTGSGTFQEETGSTLRTSIGISAANTPTGTTNFDNNLSSADDTVQKALETLDELSAGGGGGQELYDAVVDAAGGADYTDIQSAITAGAKTIYVREGTYTLSADIAFAANETVLVGESWDTVIDCGASYKIDVGAYDNCVIKNLKATGTNTSGTAGTIRGVGCDNVLIENCSLDAAVGLFFANANNVRLKDCVITGASGQSAIRILGQDFFTEGGKIEGCYIYDFGTSTSGANVTAIEGDYQTTVTNCTINNIGGSSAGDVRGIKMSGKLGIVIGCLIHLIRGSSSNSVYGIDGTDMTSSGIIQGNEIRYCGSVTPGGTAYGIKVGARTIAKGNIVSSVGRNDSINTVSYGIYIGSISDVISGNYVDAVNSYDTSGSSYLIYNNGIEGVVSGNVLDRTLTGASKYSIYEASAKTGNVYVGNSLDVAESYNGTSRFRVQRDSSGNLDLEVEGDVKNHNPTEIETATDVAKAAQTLDQNDEDEAFTNYEGTSEAGTTKNISTLTAGNSIQGFVKVEINGTAYWMPYYDAPTS